jgi:hypothetical protein
MPRAARRLTRDTPLRRMVSDIGAVAGRRHAIPAWFTVDVTDVLPRLHTEPHVSLTVLVAGTVARVVARHPRLHALRDVRGRVVTFEEVDVNVSVEAVVDGQPFPVNHVLRSSQVRSLRDLGEELHRVKAEPEGVSSRHLVRAAEVYLTLPAPVRRCLLGSVRRFPDRQKALMGTVGVTSVGMHGRGGGVGLPFLVHTLDVLVGGLETRPGFDAGGAVVPRQHLSISVVVDHDVVDGAPLARFIADLRDDLEAGRALD